VAVDRQAENGEPVSDSAARSAAVIDWVMFCAMAGWKDEPMAAVFYSGMTDRASCVRKCSREGTCRHICRDGTGLSFDVGERVMGPPARTVGSDRSEETAQSG
jgi:hypothetical protein